MMQTSEVVDKPVVDFSTIIPEAFQDVYEEDFKAIGSIDGEDVPTFIENFAKDFNKLKTDDIFVVSRPYVDKLVNLFCQKVSIKFCEQLASNWPTIIALPNKYIKPIFYMFVKSAMAVDDPLLYLAWLTRAIFPITWIRTGPKFSPIIVGISYGKVGQQDAWVIFDVEYRITVYVEKDGEASVYQKVIIDNMRPGEPGTIAFIDKKGKELLCLQPEIPKHVDFWLTALNGENRTAFTRFISKGNKVYPEQYKIAVYLALTANDMTILKTLSFPNIISVKDRHDVAEAMFDISRYASKVSILIATILSTEFEDPNIQDYDLITYDSLFTDLIAVYVKNFGAPYFNKVIKKILKYIDSKGDLKYKEMALYNKEQLAKIFFTAFKYIFSSLDYIPNEIRHIGNILRRYTTMKFNSRRVLIQTLSKFFFVRFFIPLMKNPEICECSYNVVHKDAVNSFIELFEDVCKFKKLAQRSPDYVFMDKRSRSHLYPEMEKFLCAAVDYDTPAKYKAVSKDVLDESICRMIEIISDANREFDAKYLQLEGLSMETSTVTGWNYASAVMSMFSHSYDKDIIEGEATKAKDLDILGDIEAMDIASDDDELELPF